MNSGYDGSLPEALGGIFTFIWWYFHFYFHLVVFSLSSPPSMCFNAREKDDWWSSTRSWLGGCSCWVEGSGFFTRWKSPKGSSSQFPFLENISKAVKTSVGLLVAGIYHAYFFICLGRSTSFIIVCHS